jgi:hypothetical protein
LIFIIAYNFEGNKMISNKSVLIPLFLTLTLSSCGDDFNLGGSEDGFNLGGGNGSNLNGGGTGGGSGGGTGGDSGSSGVSGEIGTLNCENLDPDKVYVFGYLKEAWPHPTVLSDAENLTTFCAGFATGGDVNTPLRPVGKWITPSGKFLYRSGIDSDIKVMKNDQITIAAGAWVYPAEPEENDELLLDMGINNLTIGSSAVTTDGLDNLLFIDQSIGTIGGIYDNFSELYYANPEQHGLLGSLPDGSLLMYSSERLIRADPSGTEINLVSPPGANPEFVYPFMDFEVPSKLTSDNNIWVVIRWAGEIETWRRWRIDLADNSVVEDGIYAAMPVDPRFISENADLQVTNSRLDGAGNLWQITRGPNSDFDVIVKRPLISSGGVSAIIGELPNFDNFSHDWTKELNPTPSFFEARLITGP